MQQCLALPSTKAGRIPTLTIHPEGVGDRRVTMTLDGQNVLAIEQPQSVDPGHHEVVLVVGAKRYVKVVELREGEHPVVAIPVDKEAAALVPKAEARAEGPKPLLVVGATSLAVGGAGVIVWGATPCLAAQVCGVSRKLNHSNSMPLMTEKPIFSARFKTRFKVWRGQIGEGV